MGARLEKIYDSIEIDESRADRLLFESRGKTVQLRPYIPTRKFQSSLNFYLFFVFFKTSRARKIPLRHSQDFSLRSLTKLQNLSLSLSRKEKREEKEKINKSTLINLNEVPERKRRVLT